MSDTELTQQLEEQPITDPVIKEMIAAGVFYGRTKTKTHPRMKSYILANRAGIEVINLEKTKEMAEKAAVFLKSKVEAGGQIIVAATQPIFSEAIAEFAAKFNLPAVTNRWLGGTLTNYKVISRRVEYFKKLKQDLAAGYFKNYTKKEQLDIQKEIEKLAIVLTGLENMVSRPELLIVIDPTLHMSAVKEARVLGIPVIAFVNTDTDPDFVNYPVLGNTKAKESAAWFLKGITEAMEAGVKAKASAAKAAEVKSAE